MQLVAWLGICLLGAVILHERPLVLAVASLSTACLVPGASGHLVTGVEVGQVTAVQPAAALATISLLMQVLLRPQAVGRLALARPVWWVLLLAVCLVAVTTGVVQRAGLTNVAQASNQVVGPVSLFALFGLAIVERPARVELVRNWVLGLAAFEAAFALLQYTVARPILFESDYARQVFYHAQPGRWMGTLDHPLILGLFLAVSTFLVAGVRRWWVALSLILLYGAGLMVSQSRAATGAAALGTIYVIVVGRSPVAGRVVVAVGAVAGAIFAVASGATAGLQSRLADDTGSTAARRDALSYFIDHRTDYLWLGGGLDSSFGVSDSAGLLTSFENAFIMSVIDLGLIVALMYFSVMALTAWRSLRGRTAAGYTGAAVGALALIQTFSALSGVTAAPAVVWTVFAMAGFAPLRRSPRWHRVVGVEWAEHHGEGSEDRAPARGRAPGRASPVGVGRRGPVPPRRSSVKARHP